MSPFSFTLRFSLTPTRRMAGPVATLLQEAAALGIEAQFLQPLEHTIDNVRRQLEAL